MHTCITHEIRLQTVSLDVPVDEDSPQKKPPADVEAIAMAQVVFVDVCIHACMHAHMAHTRILDCISYVRK